jgi:outer membrane protein assembly factor BamB
MKRLGLLLGLCLLILTTSLPLLAAETVEEVVQQSGFEGGVVLHLGCGDGSLMGEIHTLAPNSLLHGLESDMILFWTAQKQLYDSGLYGPVTVAYWDEETIPFVSNFANLIIVEEATDELAVEIDRVLAPGGTALIGDQIIVKERPDEMDQWHQYLYDATGNAVSQDELIRPPLYHLQWVGGPRWARHHDVMSSVSACVSSDNKIFYIFDEGSSFSPLLPSRWKLICRDAFNGTILWKRDIDHWFPNLHGLKSGPASLPRRLIAIEDRVYVTLGIEAPVSVLDAASGETIATLPHSEGTEEIIYDDQQIYLVVDDSEGKSELARSPYSAAIPKRTKRIVRFDLGANEIAWEAESDWIAPMTLCADESRLYYFDGETVVAQEKTSGDELWISDSMKTMTTLPVYLAPKLLVHDGIVMFVGSENYDNAGGSRGDLTAVSAESGETLWTARHPACGYKSPEDLFIIDERAWSGDIMAHRWFENEFDSTSEMLGVDIRDGSEQVSFTPDVDAYWFHHRCHPGRATENYIITSRTGIEFVDPKTQEWSPHHWIRGACLYGVMPANGMIYAPQHPCACYLGAKLFGFNAIAPRDDSNPVLQPTPDEKRLTPYGSLSIFSASDPDEASWPAYRHDNQRSGAASCEIENINAQEWSVQLPGRLTPPVLANGKIVVSLKDRHAVYALDAKTGEVLWRFIAGGRVDSAPTLYNDHVYFGATDGLVYCLNLIDGAPIWTYQAAPTPLKHMYFENLESTHPVHGSVLVEDGKVHLVAGRSMFVDGGIRFLILNAGTGKKLTERVMGDTVPGTDEPLQMRHEVLNMPVALPDILVGNRENLFLRYQKMDWDGERQDIGFDRGLYGDIREDIETANSVADDQTGPDAHLFSGSGFLDDTWWHRTYWIFGKTNAAGWAGYHRAGRSAPAGRIMSFDDERIYTWGREKKYFKWSKQYRYYLYASDYEYEQQWGTTLPILPRAMVLADEKLFLLGPREVLDQEAAVSAMNTVEQQELATMQEQELGGENGSVLLCVDPTSGETTHSFHVDALPEFDGMVAAYGRIYASTTDGRILCLGNEGEPMELINATTSGE